MAMEGLKELPLPPLPWRYLKRNRTLKLLLLKFLERLLPELRQLKSITRYSEPTASSVNLSRAPKVSSPKVGRGKFPTSPASVGKCPDKVSELECQIFQLEVDLKTVKEQLFSAEASNKQANTGLDESNQQLLTLSSKLEQSQKQILDHSASAEVNRIVLQELLEGHDLSLQSELKTVQKQHSNDLSTLASALDEIKQLQIQLQTVAMSEAKQSQYSESVHTELRALKESMIEGLSLLEDVKSQIRECKESEARSQELVIQTLNQLETSKKMVETLRWEGSKTVEAYRHMMPGLDQAKARVKLTSVRAEAEKLRSALESVETKYADEQARSKEQMKTVVAMLEEVKSESSQREAELGTELSKSLLKMEEMKAKLMDKETELQGVCTENEELTRKLEITQNELENELEKSKADVENLKILTTEKEIEWQKARAENEELRMKLQKIDFSGVCTEAVSDIESSEAAEREASFKIACLTEEVEKSKRRADKANEQIEAARRESAEMEGEMRRVKVQADQWRKAAEAAAAMLSAENDGHAVERTGSMDSNYSPRMGKMDSPYGDDPSEDFSRKKNGNVLRKFGNLWKKQQK